jgi:hypothetical protein
MLEDHRAVAGELPVKGDAIRDTAEKFCERRLAVLNSASSDRAARAALSIQRSLADINRKNADRRSTRGSVSKTGPVLVDAACARSGYSPMVRITLLSGRVLLEDSLSSCASISSYFGTVVTSPFGTMCTTL